MGIVNFSIPKELVLAAISKVNFKNFLETGTYKGGTSLWAAQHFENVYTIEIDKGLADDFISKLPEQSNITCITGDSREVMPLLVQKLNGRTFCWLDGHWCSGAGGKEAECPLIEELEALKNADQPLIFIDDARCFIGPMPPPHDSSHWPSIDDIFLYVHQNFPGYKTTIIDDVIIIMPPDLIGVINNYWMNSFDERYYGVKQQHASSLSSTLKKYIKKILPV